jgi:hypothetical protein
MISKLLFISAVIGFGVHEKKHEEEEKETYDLENEDDAYIYDRSHGDDDIRKRKRNALEWLEYEFPILSPHHNNKEGDLHAIDAGHMVDEAFRLSF